MFVTFSSSFRVCRFWFVERLLARDSSLAAFCLLICLRSLPWLFSFSQICFMFRIDSLFLLFVFGVLGGTGATEAGEVWGSEED